MSSRIVWCERGLCYGVLSIRSDSLGTFLEKVGGALDEAAIMAVDGPLVASSVRVRSLLGLIGHLHALFGLWESSTSILLLSHLVPLDLSNALQLVIAVLLECAHLFRLVLGLARVVATILHVRELM